MHIRYSVVFAAVNVLGEPECLFQNVSLRLYAPHQCHHSRLCSDCMLNYVYAQCTALIANSRFHSTSQFQPIFWLDTVVSMLVKILFRIKLQKIVCI